MGAGMRCDGVDGAGRGRLRLYAACQLDTGDVAAAGSFQTQAIVERQSVRTGEARSLTGRFAQKGKAA